ncbi:MAG: hypothetical protein U9N14_06030, partial [Pseudomonadota bacterium]|nr:hypothetical protein [Pseudomonadota bacterium]
MRKALIISAGLHLAVMLALAFDSPWHRERELHLAAPIPVELVTAAEIEKHAAPPAPEPKPVTASKPRPKPVNAPEPAPIRRPEPPKIDLATPVPDPEAVTTLDAVLSPVPEGFRPSRKPSPPQPKSRSTATLSPSAKPAPPREVMSVLKDLTTKFREETRSEDTKAAISRAASSSTAAPQGARRLRDTISLSEIDAVRAHVARCWNVPVGARDAKDMVAEVLVELTPDGTVRTA